VPVLFAEGTTTREEGYRKRHALIKSCSHRFDRSDALRSSARVARIRMTDGQLLAQDDSFTRLAFAA